MTEDLRTARGTDTYICRGDKGVEVWQPRFTTHGFHYVELSELEQQPSLDMITVVVLHSDGDES